MEFNEPALWIIIAVVIVVILFIGIYLRMFLIEQRRITP
jgi:type II secretory pathway component PulF